MDAMKEAKELAESNHRIYGTQLSEALRSAVTGALNERERLRQLLKAATSPTKCYCNVMAGNQCWHCEAREALNEQKGESP